MVLVALDVFDCRDKILALLADGTIGLAVDKMASKRYTLPLSENTVGLTLPPLNR